MLSCLLELVLMILDLRLGVHRCEKHGAAEVHKALFQSRMLLQGHLVRLPKRHQRSLLRPIIHDTLLLSFLPLNDLILLCLNSFRLLVEILSPFTLSHLALFILQVPEVLESGASHQYG